MCGICGILAISDSFTCDAPLARRMRDTMVHRGPDDAGARSFDRVALAHRRLSIVDLSASGRQPMANEDDSLWITFNGEIYNHRELRAGCRDRGHTYRSETDTETILHLYEEEGPRCVERLQGMFAFAIWDTRRRELFLARDRLGIKPLYFARPPGGFLFASEIKALLEHPAIHADLDETSFAHYLTFVSTPAPATMFAGIQKLAPAERMLVRADGTVESEIWWSPFSDRTGAETRALDDAAQAERLVELLRASVGKRMMADVPFGVFLSGGVDSSTTVALMSELTERPVQTFSVAFEDDTEFDELPWARRVAERFGADHHEVRVAARDLEAFLPTMVHHQDEPIADWVCLPLHFVSQLARDHGTIVVQVGEGADELLHGYDFYMAAARLQRTLGPVLGRVPESVGVLASTGLSALADRAGRGRNTAAFAASAVRGRVPFWGGAICFQGPIKDRVMHPNGNRPDPYSVVERLWGESERAAPTADYLQRMTYLELKQRLAELLLMRVDKMTMATSVEARVPFLDHELVEFALALPPRAKVRDGVGKHLLKEAVAPIVGRDVAYRTKQGFTAPIRQWFRGDTGLRAREVIRRSSLAERGLLDYEQVDRLWAAHRAGRADWSFQLWNLYNVSAWHDHWVAGRPPH